ncbi:MAG: class I SAM-dependent methyltransferase [Azospirillaceae bacterium]
MTRLLDAHVTGSGGTAWEIGSFDVSGGTLRPHLERRGWRYVGVDIAVGPNVDIVLDDPYVLPASDGSVDLLVSAQAFEHIEFFWLTFKEMARVLRPGGWILLLAPSRGPEHRYPVDCWRFYPDGYRALAKWGGLEAVEVGTDWRKFEGRWPRRRKNLWGDTWGAFQKPEGGEPKVHKPEAAAIA